MELRHLRYFVAVAEELHVTRAAAKLGIAQPPLTQQIKALERELNAKLFARSGRGIVLTEVGAIFLPEAKAILAQASVAVAKARDAGAGLLGRLNLGFTESASFHPLVAEIIRAFRSAYPGVEMTLQEGHSPELIAALVSGKLDLAFVRPPFPANPDVRFDILAEETMVAALPMTHRLSGHRSLKLQDLTHERFILYPRAVRPGLSDSVIRACRQCGFEPKVAQEAPQLSSTINLVAAGMGVSVVPEGMRQVRPKDVRYLPIRNLALKAHLSLAGRAVNYSPLADNFRIGLKAFQTPERCKVKRL